jgi:hypothetical protein
MAAPRAMLLPAHALGRKPRTLGAIMHHDPRMILAENRAHFSGSCIMFRA